MKLDITGGCCEMGKEEITIWFPLLVPLLVPPKIEVGSGIKLHRPKARMVRFSCP
jgi:hypothetical protein